MPTNIKQCHTVIKKKVFKHLSVAGVAVTVNKNHCSKFVYIWARYSVMY